MLIKIIDLKCGNINSATNIFKFLGCEVEVVNNFENLNDASAIVIPGNGNFNFLSNQFEKNNIEKLFNYVLVKKKPILGICIGLQIFFSNSSENDIFSKGLNFFNGNVEKLINQKKNKQFLLPHIGWNNINIKKKSLLFSNINDDLSFYFLHSYACKDYNNKYCIASSVYGEEFISVVEKDNIVGLQFHPEKSHDNGIMLITNWLKYYVKN